MRLDTAYEHWDQIWKTQRQDSDWGVPEPEVFETITGLVQRRAHRVLDLGAGVGRHTWLFAEHGFEVVAVDASPSGVQEIEATALTRGMRIDIRQGAFVEIPLDDSSVDHVLAWNVIYHGDGTVASRALGECRRVVKSGGSVHFTMLSKRNSAFGVGKEIAPDTFVDSASASDKRHPHFYLDRQGLQQLLADHALQAVTVQERAQSLPGGFHWHVFATT